MNDKQARFQQAVLLDEELEGVVGGVQTGERARCAKCHRDYAPGALYTLGGQKLCPSCYRQEIKK